MRLTPLSMLQGVFQVLYTWSNTGNRSKVCGVVVFSRTRSREFFLTMKGEKLKLSSLSSAFIHPGLALTLNWPISKHPGTKEEETSGERQEWSEKRGKSTEVGVICKTKREGVFLRGSSSRGLSGNKKENNTALNQLISVLGCVTWGRHLEALLLCERNHTGHYHWHLL